MTNDVPIVEDELQAYVDGRLPEARRAAVDAYLAQHPDVRERVTLEMRQGPACAASSRASSPSRCRRVCGSPTSRRRGARPWRGA